MLYLPIQFAKERIFQSIHSDIYAYASALERYAFPLFKTNSKGRPEIIGSATLIKGSAGICIFTAGHIIDEIQQSQILIPNGEKLAELHSVATCSKIKTTRNDDNMDFAIIPIKPEFLLSNPEYKCVPVSHLEKAPPLDCAGTVFAIIGYPISINTKNVGQILRKKFTTLTSEANHQDYIKFGINPKSHILLNSNPSKMLQNGKYSKPPNYNGMSGGPLWRFSIIQQGFDKYSIESHLEGVVIQQTKDLKFIQATKFHAIFNEVKIQNFDEIKI